ncbi:MAG: S8 family serine peptidase, partial [Bryobacteraceae bacterium]
FGVPRWSFSRVPSATSAPPAGLWDRAANNYFGSTVWNGYAAQPASSVIRLKEAQSQFGLKGAGVVGIIDTGVDGNHPALKNVSISGYDFLQNQAGPASEQAIVQQSTAAVLDGGPWMVNQSTAAVLDGELGKLLGLQQYAGYGHGTMVAGIVHLVAPRTKIMSLRAFSPDGTGYLSDILRAVYWGTQNGARVLNMSFSLSSSSRELSKAMDFADQNSVIKVASAGNTGTQQAAYPAALANVMGVASTSLTDQRSSFSSYGPTVWVAAPGEGIVTTYPNTTYSAGWGTSFSAPFVAGTAALFLEINADCNHAQAAAAVAHARKLGTDLGNGRLDVLQAVIAYRQLQGLP